MLGRGVRTSRWVAARAAAALTAILAMAIPGPAYASAPGQESDEPRLEVMTRNLYLGSSLTPALTAPDTPAFLIAVAGIYGTAQFTNFAARAEAIADEIDTHHPDLVGLQEVTIWETTRLGVPQPSQDFLSILTDALADRGLNYTVASVANNANIGPIPLLFPCPVTIPGACLVTLKDRDVILINADRDGLTWHSPRSGSYIAQQSFQPPIPGAPPVSFKRGWATIEGTIEGRPFHFANTHLETEDFPGVQEAQAAEFLAGPAFGPGADIATGDFNSAADGSTTTSYGQLTKKFKDAWRVNKGLPGLTCCQNETLTNEASQFSSRIDLILSRNGAKALAASVIGATRFQDASPLWASDHAGVIATVRLGD